jgi:hypothetical protein
MITYRQMDASCLPLYDRISMRLEVRSIYKIEKNNYKIIFKKNKRKK